MNALGNIITVSGLLKTTNRLFDNGLFSRDLIKDPTEYLDYRLDLKDRLYDLRKNIMSGNHIISSPFYHYSAKGKGINRPTVTFDIDDIVLFRFGIENIENKLLKGKLLNTFSGGRLTPKELPDGNDYYEKWWKQWNSFQTGLEKEIKTGKYKFAAISDIASYFENINLLLLKDFVNSKMNNKSKELINLIFFFLEQVTPRLGYYSVNTNTGLPQDSYDCSRVLAYFYLMAIDEEIDRFVKSIGGKWYRWVDDVIFLVEKEVDARKVLKKTTEELRKLNLVASIQKTSILSVKEVKDYYYFNENKKIDSLETKIKKINSVAKKERLIKVVIDSFNKFKENEGQGRWNKIYKRYFTLFSFLQSNYLYKYFDEVIIKYPELVTSGKVLDNIISSGLNTYILKKINHYLRSEENIYQAVESSLLEFLLRVHIPKSQRSNFTKIIRELAIDAFWKKNGYVPQSAYARGLCCLLIKKFGTDADMRGLLKYYLAGSEQDNLCRKYLTAILMTFDGHGVFVMAQKDRDKSIARLNALFVSISNGEIDAIKFLIKKISFQKVKFNKSTLELPIRSRIIAELIIKLSPTTNPKIVNLRSDLVRKLKLSTKKIPDDPTVEWINSL